MNNKRNVAIGVLIIIVVIIGIVWAQRSSNTEMAPGSELSATTTDSTYTDAQSMQGSGSMSGTVGGSQTVGINPEFKFTDYTLRIGETTSVAGVVITPLAVEQDSRCAENVQCIQAGTVTVNTKFVFNNFSSTQSVTSGNEITVYGVTGTITAVNPPKVLSREIAPGEYSFVFRVKSKV